MALLEGDKDSPIELATLEIKSTKPSRTQVCLAVGFHISVALSVTLSNKAILNVVPLPIFFLLAQSVLAIILIRLAVIFKFCPAPTLDYDIFNALKYLLIAKLAAQLSKLFCLQHVNMGFYQIARGLLLPFTIGLSIWFLQNSKISKLSLIACLITMFGFGFGVTSEKIGHTSTIGILLGIGSSLGTAIATVLVKRCVSDLKLGLIDLVHASAAAMIPGCLVLLVISGEFLELRTTYLNKILNTSFSVQFLVATFLNFLLSIAALLQIKTTSPTTHMISSAARGVLQSILAVVVLNEIMTTSRATSVLIILTGSCLYTYAKELEVRQESGYELVALPQYEPEQSEDRIVDVHKPKELNGNVAVIDKT